MAPQTCTDFTGPAATEKATGSSLNALCSLEDHSIPMRAQSTGRYDGTADGGREMVSPPLFTTPHIIDRGMGLTSSTACLNV